MKKALSLFLSLVLVIGMIPMAAMSVSAEVAEPANIAEPTTSSTVNISTADAFLALLGDGKTAENTKYVLEADIDLGDKDVTTTPFILKNSVFDGGEHTITGFTMDSAGTSSPTVGGSSMSLFRMDPAQSNTAVIKNLKLGSDTDKIVIVNKNWGWASGALLGVIPTGTKCRIENVDAYVNYTHTGANGAKIAGALVGYSAGTLEMDGCTSNGTVYCLLSDNNIRGVGGMIGWISEGDATISSCTNNAAVGGYNQLGGIVGFVQADLTVTDCTNNGAISGTQTLGGIAGYITGSGISVAVTDCTNNGSMTGNFCGGIVSEFRGVAEANVTNCRNNGGINDVEAVSDAVTHCGGLIAKADGNLSVTGCTNGGNVKAINTAGGIIAQNVGAITISNCTNRGTITTTTSVNTWHGAGGLVAYSNSDVTIFNSKNEGTINGKGQTGGAIGSCDGEGKTLTLTNFVNSGSVTSASASAGAGVGRAHMNAGKVSITDMLNIANVCSYSSSGAGVGHAEDGTNTNLTIEITRLVNTGDISGRWRGCTATGYVASAKVSINNCISTGTMKKSSDNSTSYAFTEVAADNTNVTGSGNYAVNGNTIGLDGFTETLGASLDTILSVIINANTDTNDKNDFAHGLFALNSAGTNIVPATPTYEGYQEGTDSIRLLATINDVNISNASEYKYLGFELSRDGGSTYKKFYTDYVYDSVIATGEGKQTTHSAEDLGGKYIYALIIEGISEAEFDKLTVRTFAVDKNDNTLCGNAVTIALPVNN